jgi:protein-S-isoprenylcysteine O-methyltransferase Ste14
MVIFTGLDELRNRFPDLRSPVRSAWIGILAFGIFGLTILFFSLVKRYIPEWSLDGQVIVITIGFLLMRMFFTHKNTYLIRYRDQGYRNAFLRFVLPGLALVFASIAHIGYMPGPELPPWWLTYLLPIAGWYFLIFGAILWTRSVLTFGFDNLMMLYVYFPENSHRIDHKIYAIIRHPVYGGALRLGMGLALLNGNLFSLFFGLLLLPLGLTAWVRLVEERELIERFGTGYQEYRKMTPAFWPRLRDLAKFFGFLIKG